MKKIIKTFLAIITLLLIAGVALFFSHQELFAQKLRTFSGDSNIRWNPPGMDYSKKTVFIIVGNEHTEMFDFMAPYYLFNATEKTNVFVIAEKKAPVLLVNSLFILPHYSFAEIDSMHIIPDVIVLPNQTVDFKIQQNPLVVNWIKNKFTGKNIILSICDGSATAAATGIYDGKPLTTHASDFEKLKKLFPKPLWVKDISVTESGNLFSTAGVSNAVQGSLTVIKKLFGEEEMQAVLHEINYPYNTVNIEHKSIAVGTATIINVASKVILSKNYHVGVLLKDSINEFTLGSILDTYVRSYPKSIKSYSPGGLSVVSKYGLRIYPTGNFLSDKIDELHIMDDKTEGLKELTKFRKVKFVSYTDMKQYPIDLCLDRIESLYSSKFKNSVKLMLDYN